jgi:hypothetical protein
MRQRSIAEMIVFAERLCACLILLALSTSSAPGATNARVSRIAEAQFRLANPCPVTGQSQGACTGYVIDRVIPLACGGPEDPDNMRWLTIAEAKAKAKWERIGCRPGRKLVLPGESKTEIEAFPLSDAAEPVQAAPLAEGSAPAPDAPAAADEAPHE